MQSIVFFGKGGIGKSTIAANVSVLLAAKGAKLLHIGCDPKMDSTLSLMGSRIRPFSEAGHHATESALAKCLHRSRYKNIDCIEAGGPHAGVGCAGAGIGAMLDLMRETGFLEKNGYNTVVFDVLGDVVCGGFAAPLRRGFAEKAVFVVSEELYSLYAANNLAAMINNYARNGVYLAGLAVNAKDLSGVALAEQFARKINSKVLGVVPRDAAVVRAERALKPVVIVEPKSPAALGLARLAAAISAADKPLAGPRSLSSEEMCSFMNGRTLPAGNPEPLARKETKRVKSPAQLLEDAGFSVTGVASGQLICEWKGKKHVVKIFVIPASEARPGMIRFNDWTYCFMPGERQAGNEDRIAVSEHLCSFAGLFFDDFISALSGKLDFYDNTSSFGEMGDALFDGSRPKEPQVAFGQWQRFIFSAQSGISLPPGALIIEHGDIECRFSGCEPTTAISLYRKKSGLTNQVQNILDPLLPKRGCSTVNTDFDYNDAVYGDDKKVATIVSAAVNSVGPGGMVEFYTGCSPVILGSDTSAFTETAGRATGVEVLKESFNNFHEPTAEKIRARSALVVRKISALKYRAKPCGINLIGFGSSSGALRDLLTEKGLAVTPEEKEYYEKIVSSSLQLLPAPDEVLTTAFDAAGIKWVLPCAPYGLHATQNWLMRVGVALGDSRPASFFAPSKEIRQQYAAQVSNLKNKAVGFVCEPAELGIDGLISGIPVLSVLAEAGMSVRLFVFGTDAAAKAKAVAQGKALAGRLGITIKVVPFDTPLSLHKALRSDKALRIVYSDMPMDPRIAATGKNDFSGVIFEPGYAGAVETLRRISVLCDWKFNERYFQEM